MFESRPALGGLIFPAGLRAHTWRSSQEINGKLVVAEQADHANTESPFTACTGLE